MWPDLIQKSKDGGLDVIETYVFWDAHEPVRGQVNFALINSLLCRIAIFNLAWLSLTSNLGCLFGGKRKVKLRKGKKDHFSVSCFQ